MILRAALAALTLLLSCVSVAMPMEVIGTAEIFNDDIADARQRAIDNALSQAIMSQGGTVSVNQSSNNGVLADEQVNWNSQSRVRSMELLSEDRQGRQISVALRVDVEPLGAQRCDVVGGKAKIVIPRPQVRYRQQLVIGGIYQIDSAIARVLTNTLNGEANAAFAADLSHLNVHFAQAGKQWVTELSRKQQSQYVLAITIDDVAAKLKSKMLGYWDRGGERTVALNATLYDGFSGQVVWSQRYRGKGNWPYKRQEIADTATERFWNSGFGEEVRRVVTQISHDIDAALTCKPLRGRITSIRGEQVKLDIGSNNGLRAGDMLVFMPQQQQWGQSSEIMLQLEQVRPQQALARILDFGDSMGVQVGDWVERKGN
ncbi:flagellar assembly protein T N-terminal domain-containing protein [uncultured Ferrimonas sp.]|uniref:flagellar assembly protein T N-terminal domain-containing protein n=1 Tax=uncultured Ferrimonas sp. TaxID=432640 RepID=UPI00260BF727|nr:flagellar assembly protein T N-terminal domain-containing protein [uncultured Ferrimonas sp.]